VQEEVEEGAQDVPEAHAEAAGLMRPSRGSKLVSVGSIAIALALVLPGSSIAARDFGSNLSHGSTAGRSGGGPLDLWNARLPDESTAGTLVAPIGGVVVRYTIGKSGGAWSPIHLRVIRPLGDGIWSGLGASYPDVVPTVEKGTETFQARVPISVGDYVSVETSYPEAQLPLGIYLPDSLAFAFSTYQTTLAPGGTEVSPAGDWPYVEIPLQARVETDVDGDGFGDETQDRCPSNGNTQAPCSANTPVAKRKCMKHRHKRSLSAKKKCRKKKSTHGRGKRT
jgi:hypothetical protein